MTPKEVTPPAEVNADKLPPLPPLPFPVVQTGPLTRDVAIVDQFNGAQMTEYATAYALAALQAMRPKWTMERPTVPGWYWRRIRLGVSGEVMDSVVCVRASRIDGALLDLSNGNLISDGGLSHLQWYGPLPTPAEPTT